MTNIEHGALIGVPLRAVRLPFRCPIQGAPSERERDQLYQEDMTPKDVHRRLEQNADQKQEDATRIHKTETQNQTERYNETKNVKKRSRM